jgi:hypothetical protein
LVKALDSRHGREDFNVCGHKPYWSRDSFAADWLVGTWHKQAPELTVLEGLKEGLDSSECIVPLKNVALKEKRVDHEPYA